MGELERGEAYSMVIPALSTRILPRPSLDAETIRSVPNPERLKVFISYSREDTSFADQLVIGLEFAGFAPIIDRHGISGGEDWRLRLGNLIRETDTVVFVLSPASAISETCAWEAREAASLGQRIIPILGRPLEGKVPPQVLSELSYIYFYPEPKVPGSGFASGLRELAIALNTDIEWHREHTRILLRATEWDKGGRQPSRLLSGTDIQAAKDWLGKRPRTAPELTELQMVFIRASEQEAEARNNTERHRLAQIAAAQEERAKALAETEKALKAASEAQRKRARLRNLLLLATTLAAGVSGCSWYQIAQGQKQLTQQVDRANAAAARAKSAETRARLDQRRAEQAEIYAIANECTASKTLLSEDPLDQNKLSDYLSCGARLGFALVREGQPQSAKLLFDQLIDKVTKDGVDQNYPDRLFFFLVLSQGVAVAACAGMEPNSSARSGAISRLVNAANAVLTFQPPPSLEERWREEALRGAIYISNLASEAKDRELAFQYASMLVDRLSNMPHNSHDSARSLVRSLDHLSWVSLITNRTNRALNASESAMRLREEFQVDDLDYVRLNHAHALLFNGNVDLANKEYQQLNPDDVNADIQRLISFGLSHDLFNSLIGASDQCITRMKN